MPTLGKLLPIVLFMDLQTMDDEQLLSIVLSMDLQTVDDEQTSMHESTLDLTKNLNQTNDDANQKQ
jgi:hypothetical protein